MQFDVSAVEFMLPYIAASLDANIRQTTLILNSYLFSLVCFLIPFGYIADIWSRKKIFLLGLFLFGLFSLFISLSSTPWMVIAMRIFQGMAAAMVSAVGPSYIVESFEHHERGKAFSFIATAIALGYLLGPNMGAFLVKAVGWPLIFLINVPSMALLLVICVKYLPNTKAENEAVTNNDIDTVGMISLMILVFSVLMIFVYSNELSLANSMIAIFIVVTAGYFVYLGNKKKRYPALDLYLIFGNKPFFYANTVSLFSFIGAYVIAYIMPFYVVNTVLGLDLLGFGVLLTMFPLGFVIGAPIGGLFIRWFGSLRALALAQTIIVLSVLLILTLGEHSGLAQIGLISALVGVGRGVFIAPFNTFVMGTLPVYQLATGASMISFLQSAGMMLGVALTGALLYNITGGMDLTAINGNAQNTAVFMNAFSFIIGFSLLFAFISMMFSVLLLRVGSRQAALG